MGTLRQDFRYGLRMLRKSPGFTAVAVITLALAIGANTAIFSVLYPALLRPLPYEHPDRLVTLGENRPQLPCCSYTSSYPDYLDWKSTARSFASLAGFADDNFVLTGNGDPKTIYSAMVTPNFFSTLGVKPLLGRDFAEGEDVHGGSGPAIAILSYSLWRNVFAADPHVLGVALGDAHGDVAHDAADFALEPPHAGFARVAGDDACDGGIVDFGLPRFEPVRLDLAGNQVAFGDLELFGRGVAGQRNDLHAVEQG